MGTFKGLEYGIEQGNGKPIIFIHGWLGSKKFWKLITPYLDLDNPVIRYDQRCHGGSGCKPFTIRELAKDLNEMIEELELDNPILVGHSMGGMTALQYAAEYENFSGLVLLATSADTPDPENKSVEYFLEQYNELEKSEWAEEITENYVAESEKPEIREMTRRELQKADDRPIRNGLKAMIEYDVTEQLGDVEKPAAVVAAEKDGAITQDKSEQVAELLDCELKTLNTSHQMLPEKPEKVAGIIDSFVKSVS
ncbi:alpha/beta fold hydrolase [Candidatus Nanohalobium constans]|uniref:Alpha/beta hydrolase fold protein n=1 Tax=Candidatus Nanohalobium constans TaxID=2565781 RepID=A0A5Q0UHS8_9ARCH|nr:alpha/beta hydrolase [Candidatus Nanohalobium constans]QGA80901.1 alpha/beta hydrolase fold protein [Candidatus Nanohalobium constans]